MGWRKASASVLAVAAMTFAAPALAADGDLDGSFSADGWDLQHFDASDLGRDIAVQPDGKIVTVGTSADGGDEDFAVVRHMPDGSLDTSFAGTGKAEFGFGGSSDDNAEAVAIQPDGKIVVAGWTNREPDNSSNGDKNFAAIRLNPSGTLDTSFNDVAIPTLADGDGRANINIAGNFSDEARDVVIQPDGKIVLAGAFALGLGPDFAIARLLPNGNRDPDVTDPDIGNVPGVAEQSLGDTDIATSVALQDDGKIVVAGFSDGAGTNDFGIVRFDANGSPDNSFSGDARDLQNFGDDDRANGVLIQPDGKIVLAGSWDGGFSEFAFVRYETDGDLDTTFNDIPSPGPSNGDGKLSINFDFLSAEFATDVALTGDGRKLLATGFTNDGGSADNLALARVNLDGTPDTSFGGSGSAPGTKTVTLAGDDEFYGSAVQDDGQLVVAGDTNTADPPIPPRNVIVARVDSVPTPRVSVGDTTATESGSAATFAVTLDKPSAKPVEVDFATADGSAAAGADYTAASGTLTFPPEETSTTVDVALLGDSADEPDETFTLALSGARNAAIADGSASGTIADDDPTPAQPGAPVDPFPGSPSFVGSIELDPRTLRGARRGPSVRSAGRTPVGTTVSYELSEPATVRWRVRRARPGRRVRGRCVKPRPRNVGRKRCRRFVRVRGRFTTAGAQGRNSFRFMGRIRGRKLKRGRYRLIAVATDTTGLKSKRKRAKFRIVRR